MDEDVLKTTFYTCGSKNDVEEAEDIVVAREKIDINMR